MLVTALESGSDAVPTLEVVTMITESGTKVEGL